MESLRILQRQALQHVLRARPQTTALRQTRMRARPTSFATPSTPAHTRLLHTQFRSVFSRPRAVVGPSRRASSGRGFATATATSGESLSLSQRLRKLSREYGWSAVGVYFFLSALDFPFCFLAVKLLGTDRIGHWEHVVVSTVKEWVKWPLGDEAREKVDGAVQEVRSVVQESVPVEDVRDRGGKRILEEDTTYVVADHGYKEAAAANRGANASIWTQLALAYAIHKSFIFIRVPLTAAVTPKVVKTLRSWGWNIGKRPGKKLPAESAPSSTAGVNTRGSGVKND